MKRIIFFCLALVGFSISFQLLVQVSAADVTPAVSATAIEYKLPYPGILSDHPLYKLKKLRDKLLLIATADPIKKAQLHLHIADKTLLIALKVAEKNNVPLAIKTAFDGENHVTLMVAQLKNAVYYNNKFDASLVNRAHDAAKKHQELLQGISEKGTAAEKEQITTILEFSSRNDKELEKLEAEFESR